MYVTGPLHRAALRRIYHSACANESAPRGACVDPVGDDALDEQEEEDDLMVPGPGRAGQDPQANAPYARHPYRPLRRFPAHSDAFSTIMQWLFSRLPHEDEQRT